MSMDFQQDYIKRGSHKIYVAKHGPSSDRAFLFLHGGPGIGFSIHDKQLFDFSQQQVIFFDQRGCGKSLPKGEIKRNRTEDLLEDIDSILDLHQINQVTLVGGSWGSTLALLYAIKNPNRVERIILRGLFCATAEERRYFECGGTAAKYPEAWERFRLLAKVDSDEEVMPYYFKKILRGSEEEQKIYAFALETYGLEMSIPAMNLEEVRNKVERSDYKTAAKIFAHYSVKNFFITDNYIWENLSQLASTPIQLVHGKNDQITRIQHAQRLADFSSNFKLIETNSGHSAYDTENFLAVSTLINNVPHGI